MIRHSTHINHQEQGTPKSTVHYGETTGSISTRSRRGLWGMIAFLAISLAALAVRDCDLIAALPGTVQELLGDAPPPLLIHVALAVSTVSALILIVGRGTGTGNLGYRWINICLPVLFYPLYLVANTGRSSFILVMLVGMTLLLLEHLTVRYCSAKDQDQGHRLSRKKGGL